MLKHGFKKMLAEANAVINTLSVDEALALVDDPNVLFVDIREDSERAKSGVVRGSIHTARGFLEFKVDPESPMYDSNFDGNRKLVLYCATGGRSALAAKTLIDMGYSDVAHIGGGFAAWKDNNGPIE
jgi:rhodanese-related sulfurtransferase